MSTRSKLITVPEAAQRFGATIEQVRYWLRARKITRYKVPLTNTILVDPEEISRQLEMQIVPPKADDDTGDEANP